MDWLKDTAYWDLYTLGIRFCRPSEFMPKNKKRWVRMECEEK